MSRCSVELGRTPVPGSGKPHQTDPVAVSENLRTATRGLAAAVVAVAGALFALASWTPVASAAKASHNIFLFPSASQSLHQGCVRVIAHSDRVGEVRVEAIGDTPMSRTFSLSLDSARAQQINSDDQRKGLTGSTGAGDWRPVLTSELDIEVPSYIGTPDGFLTAMHHVAPIEAGGNPIAACNPGSNIEK